MERRLPAKVEAIREAIRASAPIYYPIDDLVIEPAARLGVEIDSMQADFGTRKSLMDTRHRLPLAYQTYLKALNLYLRYLTALGIGPVARAGLLRDSTGAQANLAAAEAQSKLTERYGQDGALPVLNEEPAKASPVDTPNAGETPEGA